MGQQKISEFKLYFYKGDDEDAIWSPCLTNLLSNGHWYHCYNLATDGGNWQPTDIVEISSGLVLYKHE